MVTMPLGLLPDPLPSYYNRNAHCPFHKGAPKHDLDGYYALKHKLRELIDSNILSFKDVGPNFGNNPLLGNGE